jgi:hypothetical protein
MPGSLAMWMVMACFTAASTVLTWCFAEPNVNWECPPRNMEYGHTEKKKRENSSQACRENWLIFYFISNGHVYHVN